MIGANGVVYITPSGIFREVLTAEQVVLVDLDNNQLGCRQSLIGNLDAFGDLQGA